jgi:hypothetical protein
MATAYTSLLGLALPVTGELSGSWGDIVNDSITSLLDSAISGTTTLSADADVTLTTTDGVANQARQAILLWTAGGSTTRNITAPAHSKAYFVVNKTSGTQSIVIRGVGPTTGVTVLAGTQSLVVWDGVDFVEVASGDVDGPSSATDNAVARFNGTTGKLVQNSLVTIDDSGNVSGVVQINTTTVDATNVEVTNIKAKDGTAALQIADSTGVVSVTAAPVLTALTASQAVFTDGSKALVSNAITGTGDVVMSTSPTLVTPALGAPSSVTLTNGTGLPISTGVSGLGAGVATFLATPSSANLATAVTDETGSGALVFATSPTLVTPDLGTPSALVGTNITGTAAGLTAGNVTTNADLTGAVTSVGNATSLGSFTSAQLSGALTDETGSGSAVFATSPTLVTPALGTPSSATLTNATGLPISTGVSGLGSGVATFLATPSSANLRTAVTDETGTGALVFATSPTLVTPALGTPSALVGTNITGTAAGLTAGSVTTNANLTGAVTSVGNATSLGSFTSAQLAGALTDETGSGSAVFATSPTLVTPALGTPSSATLTNATGLPISTGVSGLGAGVATFLATPSSANLAAAVTGETGTGALVFATSPTLVTPALGTPSSATLTNATGLPVATGISGLGSGVATFLATPSSANLRTAVTDETGTGALVFATSPTLVTPALGTPASGVVTNLTGTASININGTVGATTPNTGNFTVLTENASPVVVQTDIGSAPNEIPLNQYLGNLAYQDAANIAGPVGVGGALTVVGETTLAAATMASATVTGAVEADGGVIAEQLLVDNFTAASSAVLRGGSTNLLTYSEQFDNADWTKQNVTVTANVVAAPDGTLTAELVADATSATPLNHRVHAAPAITAGVAHTASFFVRNIDATWVHIRDGTNGISCWFNLVTKTVGTNQFSSAQIIEVGNEWLRLSVAWTPAVASSSIGIGFAPSNGVNLYTTSTNTSIHTWGAQLNTGSTPAAYLQTVANAVTTAYAAPIESPNGLAFPLLSTMTPARNADMTFELASDTSLVVKVKGSDGTVRSATLTLA